MTSQNRPDIPWRNPPKATSAPPAAAASMCGCNHFVQFYERDETLTRAVAAFFAPALIAGDSAIVIATDIHRAEIEKQLRKENLDLDQLRRSGRYTALDAAETLGTFMIDGTPDGDLFRQTVGSMVERSLRSGSALRGFGEMVALLWAEGNGAAAIRLEELWNELAETYPFSLFCAYPMNEFKGEAHREAFTQICQTHTHVIPAESYASHSSDDDRLREITMLQQRAASLELEMAHRKKAREALEENEARLSLAVAIADLGVWELDTGTGAMSCSMQARVHLGLDRYEPILLHTAFARLEPDDRAALERKLEGAACGSGGFAHEVRVHEKGGHVRWLAMQARPASPDSPRLVGVTLDVTERKEIAGTLENMVADRTAELQMTVEALEAFGHNVAHDLRTPLRSMRSFAEIVLGESGSILSQEHRDHLQRIIGSGAKMDRLIQDILTFSRMSSTELTLEPVNLDHLIRGVIECYPHLQQPQATIRIEGVLPTVMGNAAALTQCVSNLLGNAVKFVPSGRQPCVRLWSERAIKTIRIYVQDNGIGMDESGRGKIFGIFQRLDTSFEGSGVGLSIVKNAVSRMGGSVGCDSELGKGSTFWLDLPSAQ